MPVRYTPPTPDQLLPVPGVTLGTVAARIKKWHRDDLLLAAFEPGATAAGVFTQNRFCAAPVIVCRRHLEGDARIRAIVVNAGNANAGTGDAGIAAAEATCAAVASMLGCAPREVLPFSTGVIMEALPVDKIVAALPAARAALGADHWFQAVSAIMTTDTVPKTAGVTGDGWMVGGMAKGAGMLAPGLATMLCVLTTDAVVDPAGCDAALRVATARTFDRVDSDGCMSTNDTVLLLASGASGVAPEPAAFAAAVERLCADLCRQLLTDAEGATKDIAIEVVGAATEADAIEVGRAVARSNLLKCAFFGNDPNWGRVLAAVGTTSAAFEPDALDVAINGVQVCRAGGAGEPRELVDLSGRDIAVLVDLHAGLATATVWTNDLSLAYVHENSAYST